MHVHEITHTHMTTQLNDNIHISDFRYVLTTTLNTINIHYTSWWLETFHTVYDIHSLHTGGSVELTLLIQSRSPYLGMQSNTVWSNSLVAKQNIQMILQTFCSNTQTQKLEGLLGFPDLHFAHFQRMSYIVSASTIPVAERVQTFCHQSNCICTTVPEM